MVERCDAMVDAGVVLVVVDDTSDDDNDDDSDEHDICLNGTTTRLTEKTRSAPDVRPKFRIMGPSTS